MIDGARIKPLTVLPDERGRLMEILRCDDEDFERFGQIYITTAYPGVVKAWHFHRKQTDYLCPVHGMLKIVLYDARKESPTHGELMEIFAGVHAPKVVVVPPGVYHGFKCVSEEEGIVVNCPTHAYNRDEPDEFRLPPDTPEIDYDWKRVDR